MRSLSACGQVRSVNEADGRTGEVSCFEHAPVKLKKTASGSEEWLDAAVAYRIHLRTNGTATSAIGILTSRRMPRGSPASVKEQLRQPSANGERAPGVNQSGRSTDRGTRQPYRRRRARLEAGNRTISLPYSAPVVPVPRRHRQTKAPQQPHTSDEEGCGHGARHRVDWSGET